MDLSTITAADFKAYFRRDFPYAPPSAETSVCSNLDKYVFDFDIDKAFVEAQALFNQDLWSSDAQLTMAYLYLTAHFLSIDMRNAAQGIQSTGGNTVSSRTVGSVSETYDIPQAYKDNAAYAFYITTGYGTKYLNLALPRLTGNIGAVYGGTNP